MTIYTADKMEFEEDADADDPTWDANDWCYVVTNTRIDDIVCICATQEEANHIAKLLNATPYEG
jgi:hypothetical protein